MSTRSCPAEFSNWRDEQRAWRETAVLFDQSHHMVDIIVEGPDAMRMLNHLGINTFANFPVNRAKQFVPAAPRATSSATASSSAQEEAQFNLVGRAPVINWVEYHAETGD